MKKLTRLQLLAHWWDFPMRLLFAAGLVYLAVAFAANSDPETMLATNIHVIYITLGSGVLLAIVSGFLYGITPTESASQDPPVPSRPRIVCSALHLPQEEYPIVGIRHFDSHMRNQISQRTTLWSSLDEKYEDKWAKAEQGFLDQFGKFYTREDAWEIAEANNQIIRRVGGDMKNGGTLFSENLY